MANQKNHSQQKKSNVPSKKPNSQSKKSNGKFKKQGGDILHLFQVPTIHFSTKKNVEFC